jgi:segregation and condensation protein B
MNAQQIVEAVLFAADAPLTPGEIARADEMLDEDQVEEVLRLLRAEYDDSERAFQLVELAEGHQILTRAEYAPYLERFDNVPRSARLSGPALETLAIIAYRQPIGRLEMEYVRGVSVAGVIRTLQERNLIDVVGRAEGLGRPLLYGTTQHFLEHFGFKSLEDLPRPEELPIVLRERIPLGVEELEAVPDEEEAAPDAPLEGAIDVVVAEWSADEEGAEQVRDAVDSAEVAEDDVEVVVEVGEPYAAEAYEPEPTPADAYDENAPLEDDFEEDEEPR